MEPLRKRPRRGKDDLKSCPPTVPVDPFAAFNISTELCDGVRICAKTGSSLPHREYIWVFKSIEAALRPMYDQSRMGWDSGAKKREMRSPEQRYVVAYSSGNASVPTEHPIGFVSYRVLKDDSENEDTERLRTKHSSGVSDEVGYVMYIYELFVAEQARRQGVAQKLMEKIQQICWGINVHKIVLTVFETNAAAMRLYRDRLGFTVDASSPSQFRILDSGYEILSKQLVAIDAENVNEFNGS